MTDFHAVRRALPEDQREDYDQAMADAGITPDRAAVWESWRERVPPDPAVRAAAERVTAFAEAAGAQPGHESLLAVARYGPVSVPLTVEDLSALVHHTGSPRPLPVLVTHHGPWKWNYLCAGRPYWVERRSADRADPEFCVYDMGEGRMLDYDRPIGRAPSPGDAAGIVRTHRAELFLRPF